MSILCIVIFSEYTIYNIKARIKGDLYEKKVNINHYGIVTNGFFSGRM